MEDAKIMHDSLFSSHLQLCPCVLVDCMLTVCSGTGGNSSGANATCRAAVHQYTPARPLPFSLAEEYAPQRRGTIRKSNMNPKNNGSYKEGEG